MLYIALYAPSSVQRVVDFVKTVYAFNDVIPIIIRPYGAASQIGVPEAFRISYRLGKPLILVPEIEDLETTLGISKRYFITDQGSEKKIEDIEEGSCIIINGGDQEPSKKELLTVEPIKLAEIPSNLPSPALVSVLLIIKRGANILKK